MSKATPPSAFWERLTEALKEIQWPTSQNGIATKLDMSQGSVRRWYTGDGLPETKTIIELADKTKVSLDWLLLNRGQKRETRDPDLDDLVRHWKVLSPASKQYLLSTASMLHGTQFTGSESARAEHEKKMEDFTRHHQNTNKKTKGKGP